MITPASSSPMKVRAQRQQGPVHAARSVRLQRPKTLSSTQPTVSTTSRAIMTIASVMGRLKERRSGHEVVET